MDKQNQLSRIHIKVYQGSVLKKTPPRERYIQIMPGGRIGAVYKGTIYPLYKGYKINILDQGLPSNTCRQAGEQDNLEFLIDNLPVYYLEWFEEHGMKLDTSSQKILLHYSLEYCTTESITSAVSGQFEAASINETCLALTPLTLIEPNNLGETVYQLLLKGINPKNHPSSVPSIESLERQLTESRKEVATLRKELQKAQKKILELSMTIPLIR